MKLLILFALLAAAAANPFVHSDAGHSERIAVQIEARKGEFPFVVAIKRSGGFYCAGSIVNDNWIVTAGHCSIASISGYEIVAGEHNLNVDEGTEQSGGVRQIVRHPNYNSNTLTNDISLMRLATPLTFNEWVQPAKLAPSGFEPLSPGTLVGWAMGSLWPVLRKVVVPLPTEAFCKSLFPDELFPGQMCMEGCFGNSGGSPVLSEPANTLTGVMSWNQACTHPQGRGIFTEIAYYSNWITQNTT